MTLASRTAALAALALSVACNGSDDDTDTDVGTDPQGDSAFLTRVFPADGAVDVSVDTLIEVEFTTAVTAGEQVIALRQAGSTIPVPVDVEWFDEGTVMVAVPQTSLQFNSEYTVELDDSVQSSNPTGDDFGQGWSFFTEPEPVRIPTLVSSSPSDQSEGNSVFDDIRATFDASIRAASVTEDSAYLQEALNGGLTYGDLTVSGRTITFSPASPLQANTLYSMVFTTGIEDITGTPLAEPVEIVFGTVPALQIQSAVPANNASDVSIDQPLVVTFNQNLDTSLISEDSVTVQVIGLFQNSWNPDVLGNVTVSGNQVRFSPSGGTWQEFETNYDVRLDFNSVRGINGEPLAATSLGFTTEMVSPDYSYHLFTEGSGRGSFLQTYATPQTLFMGSGDTSSSRWSFMPNSDGSYAMLTDYGGTALQLEGGDGTGLSEMQSAGSFTGQMWRFSSYGGHPSTWSQQGFESPNVYYLETNFQGSDRALTMFLPAGSTTREGRMADQVGSIHSLFWLKRMTLNSF